MTHAGAHDSAPSFLDVFNFPPSFPTFLIPLCHSRCFQSPSVIPDVVNRESRAFPMQGHTNEGTEKKDTGFPLTTGGNDRGGTGGNDRGGTGGSDRGGTGGSDRGSNGNDRRGVAGTTGLAPRHSPLVTRPSSLTPHPSSLTPRHSPLVTHPSPLITHPSPLITHPSPLVTRHFFACALKDPFCVGVSAFPFRPDSGIRKTEPL